MRFSHSSVVAPTTWIRYPTRLLDEHGGLEIRGGRRRLEELVLKQFVAAQVWPN